MTPPPTAPPAPVAPPQMPAMPAPVLPMLSYADPVLLKRLSRLSVASFCLALTGIPAAFAAGWGVATFSGDSDLGQAAAAVTYLVWHGACLGLGLWANALIKTIRGRVADVIMAGVAVAVGSVAVGLPVLFLLGLLLWKVYR